MSKKEIIQFFYQLVSIFKKTLIWIVFCLMISTLLNLYIPILNKKIVDEGFMTSNMIILIKLVSVLLFIHLIGAIFDILKEKSRVKISAELKYHLYEKALFHLMKMDIVNLKTINDAEIFNNIETDIKKISSIVDDSVLFVVTQFFNIVGGMIGLFILDYRLAFAVLIFIPLKFFIMVYFAKNQNLLVKKYIHLNQDYAKWFGDIFSGLNEIKLFSVVDKKMLEFHSKQKNILETQKKIELLNEYNLVVDSMMVQLLIVVIYILGANFVFSMQLSIGGIFAFVTYSMYVTGPISAILNIGYLLSGIIPSVVRFNEFMKLNEEVDSGKVEEIEFKDLRIDNVCFGYPRDEFILKNVNFEIHKGEKVAIIGANGSGKSTIVSLLSRMIIPNKGNIYINSVNIADISLLKYRKLVSVVSQQIFLFNDTIENNITMYKCVSSQKIEKVCHDCGLKSFIDEVSLDYIVGDNGSLLSGGQKQKIALARALINESPILIMDEATSNVDDYSEEQINALFDHSLKNKTVIIVTHKKEILSKMDKIFELKNRKIHII